MFKIPGNTTFPTASRKKQTAYVGKVSKGLCDHHHFRAYIQKSCFCSSAQMSLFQLSGNIQKGSKFGDLNLSLNPNKRIKRIEIEIMLGPN